MRTKKSFINIAVSFISQFIIILLGFISRRVLIYSVGVDYLGINGLMTNILTIFSLAESGIGLAIGYALYKPLAENNIEEVKSLMRFFRNVYRGLALLTLVIGVAFYPFLPIFLTGYENGDANIIYWMFLFSSVVSYLWVYKTTLNSSDQNKYLYTIFNTVTQILVLIIKIVVLYFTENYILFLAIDIGTTVIKNIIFSFVVDKRYPYLKDKNVKKLDGETRKSLFINIKALFFGKIGYILSTASDNLVMSTIVSIAAVGLYSNYTVLISSVKGFVSTFTGGVTASMGNLIASESVARSYDVYKQIDFINFWLYTFTAISLLCLIDPFIVIWLGEDYVMACMVLYLSVALYFFQGINSAVDVAKSAAGLYHPDRFIPIIEALLNLGLSIVLALNFGVGGVIAGTLISFLCLSFWTKPYFVYKMIFKVSFREYVIWEGQKICVAAVLTICIYFLCGLVVVDNIFISFALKLLISVCLSNGVLFLIYHRSSEFMYIKDMCSNFIKKFVRR